MVRAESSGFQPVPRRVQAIAARVPGVATASGILYDQVEVNGKRSNLLYDDLGGVEPSRIARRLQVRLDSRLGRDAARRLHGDNAVVEEQFAKAHHIGRRATASRSSTPSGGEATLTAIGEYRDPTILQGLMVDRRTLEADLGGP